MATGVFSVLPVNFFSPLATINREHYAALLVLYYRLFQENTRGLEREVVIREFMNYFSLHSDTLAEEADDEEANDAEDIPAIQEFDSGEEQPKENPAEKTLAAKIDERVLASRFCGGLSTQAG